MARNVGPPSFRKVTRIKRSGTYPTNWKQVSKDYKDEAGRFCRMCDTTGSSENPLQTDHRIPVSKGGKHVEANFRVLCKNCNEGRNKIGRKAKTK
jgi:5-methylcytosine-specific restriction endonuclease McrA